MRQEAILNDLKRQAFDFLGITPPPEFAPDPPPRTIDPVQIALIAGAAYLLWRALK